MMQTILLNALLCLGIIWLLLLIYYTYCYIQFSRREDNPKEKRSKGQKEAKAEGKPHEAHTLVAKSKGLVSRDFPPVPVFPSEDNPSDNRHTFAPQIGAQEEPLSSTEAAPDEEHEIEVAYTMEEVDEDEVAKEEMLLSRDPMSEVSPSAILARDLLRMRGWAKNDDELDEEDITEVQATLSKVQGTDLMEKYLEHLKAEEGKHSKFLAAVRKAEEARMKAEETALASEEIEYTDMNDQPLDYYL